MSPKTRTAGNQYNDKPLPLFTIRTQGEAKTKPFVVVYEPYRGEKGNSVERIAVEKRNDEEVFTALTVFGKEGTSQQIFQSVDPDKKFTVKNGSFLGYYAVIGFNGAKLTSIYLGKGTEVSMNGYSLLSKTPDGSANLAMEGKTMTISCNQEIEIGLPAAGIKKAVWQQGSVRQELKITRSEKSISVTVPSSENAVLVLE